MPKIQTTTFNTSSQLRTEMLAKELYPLYTVNDSVWVSNSVQALFIADMGNNTYRVVISNGEFDFLSINDPTIARVWTFYELINWFTSNVSYSEYTEQLSGANTTISWKSNNIVYSATGNNPVEVLASTILQYLTSLPPSGNRQ